jgi:hypothetical protein
LRRLAALVPPARQNQVRYFGLLASQSAGHHRLPALVPPSEAQEPEPGADTESQPAAISAIGADTDTEPNRAAIEQRTVYRKSWAALLSRVFFHDVLTCNHCGGERKIISAVTAPEIAAKILAHLDLPTDLPQLAPARAPPQPDIFPDDD